MKYVSWAPSSLSPLEASLSFWASQFSYGKALEREFCHPLIFLLPPAASASQYVLCMALLELGFKPTSFTSTFKLIRSSSTNLFVVYFRSDEERARVSDLFVASTSTTPALLNLKAWKRVVKKDHAAVAHLMVRTPCYFSSLLI